MKKQTKPLGMSAYSRYMPSAFLEHYLYSYHFPGGHTPTAEQFKTWYVPLIEKLCKQHHDDADDGYYGGENAEASFWQEFY